MGPNCAHQSNSRVEICFPLGSESINQWPQQNLDQAGVYTGVDILSSEECKWEKTIIVQILSFES